MRLFLRRVSYERVRAPTVSLRSFRILRKRLYLFCSRLAVLARVACRVLRPASPSVARLGGHPSGFRRPAIAARRIISFRTFSGRERPLIVASMLLFRLPALRVCPCRFFVAGFAPSPSFVGRLRGVATPLVIPRRDVGFAWLLLRAAAAVLARCRSRCAAKTGVQRGRRRTVRLFSSLHPGGGLI